MSNVTQHALRVYGALKVLKGNNADVLDALVPFFDPILKQLDGKFFDPALLAAGVRHLYGWRFNKDIAEQFIPRLERLGLLKREGEAWSAAYIVTYQQGSEAAQPDILEFFESVVTEFEQFTPRVTDLLAYSRSREELKDILLRFLVSIDGYSTSAFAEPDQNSGAISIEENRKIVEGAFANLEEGGTPLSHEDRYMAARFVKEICATKPEYIANLARLASIGLLTEVVEDFVKPVQPAENVNLTIVVDAPLALDYLGCSGTALKQDVRAIFDALRAIGCNFVVFPESINEMERNLQSMLSREGAHRDGYTHTAMVKGEVDQSFVEAVARDAERALQQAGIGVKSLTLDQYPNSHRFFSHDLYEDFFSVVNWVEDVKPREHDAECVALIMRLREGRHSSDVFKCRYVFVTRNTRFVNRSRSYCLAGRLISQNQEGPVVHQRELATLAWLRTGLGAGDDKIPRSHLLATCDRVLQIRSQVPDAVSRMLKQFTPEKIDQFELLLLDHKSIRKLADATLNDERVVTADNAQQLLELMRAATAEEIRVKYEHQLGEVKAHYEAQNSENLKVADQARAQLEQDMSTTIADLETRHDAVRLLASVADNRRMEAEAEAQELKRREANAITGLVDGTNAILSSFEKWITRAIGVIAALIVLNFFTKVLVGTIFLTILLIIIAGLGMYYSLMNVLGREKMGLSHLLNHLGATLIERQIDRLGLKAKMKDFKFEKGRVIRV